MCQRNWRRYNASLIQRGNLSFFCDPKVIKSIKRCQFKQKGVGRPAYSYHLMIILLLIKISYGLSYRRCEGFAISLFSPYRIRIPSYTTICRGIAKLSNCLPRLSRRRPKTVMIDSSGFKISGEGEWKCKIHGQSSRRSWLKVHVIVDSKTNEIVDLIVTNPRVSDISIGVEFLKKLPSTTQNILADGAYDGEKFRSYAFDRNLKALIPPPTNASIRERPWFEERNDALKVIRGFGGDKIARSLWGKLSGYSQRSKVESAFSRIKRLFGEHIFSKLPSAQKAEVWLKAYLGNLWLNWA